MADACCSRKSELSSAPVSLVLVQGGVYLGQPIASTRIHNDANRRGKSHFPTKSAEESLRKENQKEGEGWRGRRPVGEPALLISSETPRARKKSIQP
ncbi:hypothetical protein RRG08_019574 [Elysia crispata]|uniref:Uncharacterized protein n=1 Tax=Elysia crispata TaxID=231223 RepID=A0AAE0YQX8_9GAST|nr:hypothetical protein RRG08_019574 [Elysia crispata]